MGLQWAFSEPSVGPGFWAMCTIPSCSKWHFLAEVRHPDEVRRGFTCSNNNDDKYNSCEKPEQPWDWTRHTLEKKFCAGDLVWAQRKGAVWPAMVVKDPITEAYFRTKPRGLAGSPPPATTTSSSSTRRSRTGSPVRDSASLT